MRLGCGLLQTLRHRTFTHLPVLTHPHRLHLLLLHVLLHPCLLLHALPRPTHPSHTLSPHFTPTLPLCSDAFNLGQDVVATDANRRDAGWDHELASHVAQCIVTHCAERLADYYAAFPDASTMQVRRGG